MKNDEESSIIKILNRNINIRKYQKQLSEKSFLTPEKLFSTTLESFSFQTNVPIDVCEKVLKTVSESTIPEITIVENYEPRPRFNDPILDRFLQMPDSGIVEFCGPSGAGKSNIVYHLAVQSRIYDISRKVVIISTEGRVPLNRIEQIAGNCESPYSVEEIMNGFLITEADCVEQLNEIVQKNLITLFSSETEPPPSLVIIDSIASLFRIEYDISKTPDKTRILFDITASLKWMSTTSKSLILVTNQATANLNAFTPNSNDWTPSLGYSWSNCINVRMRVTKTSMKHQISSSMRSPSKTSPQGFADLPTTASIRTIYIEISPIKQNIRAEFYIDNSGIHGL